MYISCPECNTKFMVTPEQIGNHSRKVKCSKCFNSWLYKPEESSESAENTTQIEEIKATKEIAQTRFGNGINLPALLPSKIPSYLFIMPTIIIIGLSILIFIALFSNKLGFESLFTNHELSIKDMKMVEQKDLNKIVISYTIYNNSSRIVQIPLVRVRFLDQNNRVVKSLINNHQNINLPPKEFVELKTEISPTPILINNIDIMLGNKLDFLLY